MKQFTEIPQNSIGDTLNNILRGEEVSLPALLELVDASFEMEDYFLRVCRPKGKFTLYFGIMDKWFAIDYTDRHADGFYENVKLRETSPAVMTAPVLIFEGHAVLKP